MYIYIYTHAHVDKSAKTTMKLVVRMMIVLTILIMKTIDNNHSDANDDINHNSNDVE